MITEKEKQLVEKVRRGEIDINNQSLFFSIMIKGLLRKLNEQIQVRKTGVPTFILHTGDDTMYLSVKGQDASIEPGQISNEDYVYNQIPRCIVQPKNMDLLGEQLSSPYANGVLQTTYEGSLYTLSGEFRRYPLKMTFDLTYYVDSYTDSLELIQQIISKLMFVQTFKVSYLGQEILCSYTLPMNLGEEHLMELDGTTTDRKERKISISLEVETNYPVWQNRTIVSASQWVKESNVVLAAAPTGSIAEAVSHSVSEYNGGDTIVIEGRLLNKKKE